MVSGRCNIELLCIRFRTISYEPVQENALGCVCGWEREREREREREIMSTVSEVRQLCVPLGFKFSSVYVFNSYVCMCVCVCKVLPACFLQFCCWVWFPKKQADVDSFATVPSVWGNSPRESDRVRAVSAQPGQAPVTGTCPLTLRVQKGSDLPTGAQSRAADRQGIVCLWSKRDLMHL